ncbi:hypothetical protein [Anaplasma marginale]|uniref:hypothetical protein n=1 Tax=Anaplasma marginale TaxID=770 RepID=UPI0002D67AAD|nr:hypothetical protein [Anaplasma marginale]
MGWFGPRVASRQTEEIYKKREEKEEQSFWEKVRKSGEYISKEELKGISDF